MKLNLLLLTALAVSAAEVPGVKLSVAAWPGDRLAAISLTFDDAMRTHLEVAGPVLKKHHLNGTFFIMTASPAWRERQPEWRALAADGNEIGSHTVKHPCLGDPAKSHGHEYTPAMMQAEVRDAARDISGAIDARRGLPFAYPCGSMSFGAPSEQPRNAVLYRQYISECCFATRSDSDLGARHLEDTTGRSAAELIGMVPPVVRDRAWGIYVFHGTGGEYLSVTSEALDELAAYLERHPEIWSARFGDAVRYTQERRSLGIDVVRSEAGRIEAALNWPLEPAIFDLPLTFKAEGAGKWGGARAQADGRDLPVKCIPANGATAVLVDVPPRTKRLIIERTGVTNAGT